MEKFLNNFTLKHQVARPMGYIRFSCFFLTFLISRIPLWFIIICSFLLNGNISITYTIFILLAIIICRIFIESEIVGGDNSFLFFLGIHLLKGIGALLFYFIIFGIIIYIIAPHSDIVGKVLMVIVIVLLHFFMKSDNKNSYWNGYYTPMKLSIIICLLWLYLALITDNIYINILIIFLIYTLELYNLFYNRPLGILPNR